MKRRSRVNTRTAGKTNNNNNNNNTIYKKKKKIEKRAAARLAVAIATIHASVARFEYKRLTAICNIHYQSFEGLYRSCWVPV